MASHTHRGLPFIAPALRAGREALPHATEEEVAGLAVGCCGCAIERANADVLAPFGPWDAACIELGASERPSAA